MSKVNRHQRGHQRGMSLIELMVALTIGSLLLIGTVTVYVQSGQHYRVNESISRIQENARFALEMLEPDLRLSGFWGLTNRQNFVTGRAGPLDPIPAGLAVAGDCGVNWAINLDVPVGGSNNLYNLLCPTFGIGAQLNADVLVVRHGSSTVQVPQAGVIQVQTTQMQGQLFANGALPGGFDPVTSQTNTLVAHGYYVSQDSVAMPGVPSLRRHTLIGGLGGPAIQDQEIIPGVQDFQVELGIDLTGDDSVNQYINPGPIPAGGRVVAIRISLLMRAERPEVGFVDNANYIYADRNVGPFNDNFRRVLVSRTIQLRNTRTIT